MKLTYGTFAALALILTGCASAETKWKDVMPGQTKDEVVGIMGNPDRIVLSKDGHYVYAWGMSAFTECGVKLDDSSKVEQKSCSTDQAARAQAMSSYLQMQNMQQRVPAYQPIQPYQMKLQQRTNCMTNRMGSQSYTNCSSY